jgi:hypothetical protein
MGLFETRIATRAEVLAALKTDYYSQFGDGASAELFQDLYDAEIAAAGVVAGSEAAIKKGEEVTDWIRAQGLLMADGWKGEGKDYESGKKWEPETGAGVTVGTTGDQKLTDVTDDERWGLRGPSAQIYGWEGGQPGQYQQFQGLLPDTPGYGGLSGYGQRAFQNQFAPLAAGFALQNIASPFAVEWGSKGAGILPEGFTPTPSGLGDAETGLATTGQSFYDYARNPQTGFGSGLPNIFTGFDPSLTVPTSGPTQQQYTDIFGQLAPFFAPQEAGATQEDLFAGATQSQQNVLDWVKNRDIAENLITQYALQGVDPMFRNIFQQKRLQPAFSQFYTDPALLTQPGGLMGRFLTQGIGGTGGQDPWFGGSQRWG